MAVAWAGGSGEVVGVARSQALSKARTDATATVRTRRNKRNQENSGIAVGTFCADWGVCWAAADDTIDKTACGRADWAVDDTAEWILFAAADWAVGGTVLGGVVEPPS
jgi:hypothetical protein